MSVLALSFMRASTGASSGASGRGMWPFSCSVMSPMLVRASKLNGLVNVRSNRDDREVYHVRSAISFTLRSKDTTRRAHLMALARLDSRRLEVALPLDCTRPRPRSVWDHSFQHIENIPRILPCCSRCRRHSFWIILCRRFTPALSFQCVL